MNHKSILKYKTYKAHSMVLGQCTKPMKRKSKQIKGGSKYSTTFDVLVNPIKTIIFKFRYQKYLTFFLHQANMNFYTICQNKNTDEDY